MKKKYVAYDFSCLGQTCDTREQAERAAKGMDYATDAATGYSIAFNCEPLSHAGVMEVEDRRVCVEEYLRSLKEREIMEEIYDEEVEKLHKKMFGRFEEIEMAYINSNTPYNYGDKIRLITLRASGRKRKIEATVCGVVVDKNGGIRPDLRGKSYPCDEEILSIEVLERFDYQTVNRKVICKNCQHFKPDEPHGYCFGYCDSQNEKVHYKNENKPCYVNEADKYKDVDSTDESF